MSANLKAKPALLIFLILITVGVENLWAQEPSSTLANDSLLLASTHAPDDPYEILMMVKLNDQEVKLDPERMGKLNLFWIESVEIYPELEGILKYGAEAKNGVAIIHLNTEGLKLFRQKYAEQLEQPQNPHL
ncbi:MAG: hypothetical protein ACNS62_06415 [Candidatus Cyclobacteriaceae bacterium M3_2C_046]